MKEYVIVYMDGVEIKWHAERDSLKDNVLILSKVKQQTGKIISAAEEPELVAVIPMFNVRHWYPIYA